MSFHVLERKASQEESRFFIETDSEYDSGAEDHVDHLKLILQKADALAAENSIKEAFECFSVAIGYGSFRPEQLSTLVDCILRNFKETEPDVQTKRTANMFECPCCQNFLGFAVTLTCGHSYCKMCIQSSQLYKCKLCREPVRTQPDDHKVNVVLCGLLEKWFPDEQKTFKTHWEIDELSRSKRFEEAVSLATDIIEADPGTAGVVRLSRAEAYAGLHQYQMALEDVELCLTSSHSAQYFFRNAVLLRKMGQVDQALRVFLHCLALDEDFPGAKQQVEMILWDLLSPAGEDVKEGLRETAQSASPHPHSENLIAHAQAQQSPAQSQHQHQHHPPAASTHDLHNQEIPGRWGRLEQPGLSRAHSLRTHASVLDGEVLKRVCSAPQLGGQEKGSLLKRKLSVCDPGPCVVYSAGGKQKKQGASVASCQPRTSLPQHLLDPSDLECSLCMRLFYEPVTTPCGHTFCKICLERCLDHAPHCPLCKESLKDYLETRRYTVTSVLDTLIKQYLREQHEERANMFLEETRELSDLTRSVPIFVCTMAYPTVPCPLHVFEPRYRLMVRRCMDTGTQQFGMCIHDPQKGFADHGCMLLIRSVHFLPDGRSVVDTVGGKRFRVLSRGMRDGYSIADIEHLEDTRVEDGVDRLKLQELHDTVYEQARAWFQNLKVRFHNQILQHFGPMPEREADIQATPDGPACCWWLLAVLPIDPRYQLSVLSMTTLRERLVRIQHILGYLQSVPGN